MLKGVLPPQVGASRKTLNDRRLNRQDAKKGNKAGDENQTNPAEKGSLNLADLVPWRFVGRV
jgi:hypothetical protein